MEFTFEKEENECFNFLDVKVFRENNVFAASVYCKHTRTIVRDSHYRESPTCCEQGLNLRSAEPEFRLSWMKFSSSDNHYTMAPLNYKFSLVSTIFFFYHILRNA